MPLPFLIGAIATAAGAAGLGSGIQGGLKMKGANDTMKLAKLKQEEAIALFEERNDATTELMDSLGRQELEILSSFEQFSDLMEKLQQRPEFKMNDIDGIKIPEYKAEELKTASAGASVLLGGVGGAAAGTAGGFAAAGAATSAVMALGTASTGTAISTLSGAALTNATLAALGGGSIAAGGGGMALGTVVLGGATLGIGLLIGGMIFNVTGSDLSKKSDEAYRQAEHTEEEVNKIVCYLDELSNTASKFRKSLTQVETAYRKQLDIFDYIINYEKKEHWDDFTAKEKITVQNVVLLVGLLYKMCQVKLVLKQEDENESGKVNRKEIENIIKDANVTVERISRQEENTCY